MRDTGFLKYLSYGLTVALTLYSILMVVLNAEHIDENGRTWYRQVIPEIQYAAFGLVIVFAFIVLKSVYWKHAFALLLLIATLGFIQFHSLSTGLKFSLFGIEYKGLFLFLLHWSFNPELGASVRKVLRMHDRDETQPIELNEARVSAFEVRQSDKLDEELNSIVTENKLVPEAVEAARRQLDKRKTCPNN